MSDKREKLAEDLFDRTLECATEDALEEFYAQFADENNEDIQLPSELDERVRATFEKERAKERRTKRKKRIGKLAIAMAVVLVVSVGSVDAWRVKFWNFVIEIGENNFQIRFKDDEQPPKIRPSQDIDMPEYIPKHYQIEDVFTGGTKNTIVFKDDNDNKLYYEISDSSSTSYIEYSEDDKEETKINGNEGYLIKNAEYNCVVWEWNGNVYLLRGTISMKDLLKMAESVKH